MIGKALTANSLHSGVVVFLTRAGTWSEDINDACVAEEMQAWSALELKGEADKTANLIVDPYLIEVEKTDAGARPAHIRERIRTLGPTIRTDLGKQGSGIGGSLGPVELGES